jgi:mRNA-degrading endonuclease RelE of RelBE toxin-antitoxin system
MRSKGTLRLTLTERFRKSALELDPDTRDKLKKQIDLLVSDPRHPSLRAKKIKGTGSIFEARVDRDVRFTFEYGGRHEIILRVVGPHDPTLKKP